MKIYSSQVEPMIQNISDHCYEGAFPFTAVLTVSLSSLCLLIFEDTRSKWQI